MPDGAGVGAELESQQGEAVLGSYRPPILYISPKPLLLPIPHLEGRSDER